MRSWEGRHKVLAAQAEFNIIKLIAGSGVKGGAPRPENKFSHRCPLDRKLRDTNGSDKMEPGMELWLVSPPPLIPAAAQRE